MTLYVDRINGVWEYKVREDSSESHTWTLVSKTNHFDHRDFVIGSAQNNASVKFLQPFRRFSVAERFVFPPEYNTGDPVWIDMNWLYDNGVDAMQDYIGSPERIAGTVHVDSPIDPHAAIVMVAIRVPLDYITKR
jgi:hypothetical protein